MPTLRYRPHGLCRRTFQPFFTLVPSDLAAKKYTQLPASMSWYYRRQSPVRDTAAPPVRHREGDEPRGSIDPCPGGQGIGVPPRNRLVAGAFTCVGVSTRASGT